jgi:hypothetical protein
VTGCGFKGLQIAQVGPPVVLLPNAESGSQARVSTAAASWGSSGLVSQELPFWNQISGWLPVLEAARLGRDQCLVVITESV